MSWKSLGWYLSLSTRKKVSPLEEVEKGWARKVAKFFMVGDYLSRKGYLTPLIKCINPKQGQYIMKEFHEGIYIYNSRARTMAMKLLKVRYYWPTIREDCVTFIKKCIPC